MKRLNIILSVVLFTCTTVLLTGLPLLVQLDLGQWAVLACLMLMGYTGSYLNFDIYISSIRATERINIRQAYQEGYGFGYDLGHYDGYKEGCNNTEKEINAG
jgi:hypothetical protein